MISFYHCFLKGKCSMGKYFTKIGIAALALTMTLSGAAEAAIIEKVNIGDDVSYSVPVISQGENELQCELFNNSHTIEANPGGQGFTLTSPKYSFYKVHIRTKTPSVFDAKGQQLCTVLEVKFRVNLQDETVSDYIPKWTYGMSITPDGGGNTFAGEGESQKRALDVDGSDNVIKYVINPVKKTVQEYRNDELITTTSLPALETGDITQMRFYPRPLPGKNGDGLYANGKNSINYGDDDGTVMLSTPIIWDFDYVKIYNITPYEIESSDPLNSSGGANTAGPYSVTFDTDMDESSFISDNVEMINSENGEKIMTIPSLSEGRTCTIYPAGAVEYFTKYRLSFTSAIKDTNGFYHEEPQEIEFTTEKRKVKETVAFANADSPVTLSCGESLSNGTVSGNMLLKNTASASRDIRVIAALYTKTGDDYALLNKAETSLTLESGETNVTLPNLTVTDSEKQFIKYMVWDSTGYPLTDAVICDSTHTGI